ncbi:MAG: site-specific integrase [Pseudomonadota bacterium]
MSKSFIVRRDALEWARHTESQADRHELPIDPKVLKRVTLGDLVERYRDTVSINKKAYVNERISLNAFLSHEICSKRLSELRTEDFAAFRDQRLKTIKPVSLKRQLDPVHHLFEVARDEWGLPIRTNPLDQLKLKAPSQKRERRLRPGELERLLDSAKGCRNKSIAPVIRFAVATGMRRGEILATKWTDLNYEQRSLLIPETKNGHSRTIPLTSTALDVLGEQQPETGRVFPITANSFRLAWERVKLRAGIEDLHFHDLRHEAISSFFEMGLTTPEVALISGHKDMRMLFRYAHATRQSILKRLDGGLVKA